MINRRIVANVVEGKSVVVEDAPMPSNAFTSVPGFDPAIVWQTASKPVLPWDGADRVKNLENAVPEPGGTTLFCVTFPPDSVMMADYFDPQAAGAEYIARLPGLAEKFEADNPGMHVSDTVDYDIVLDGEITVEFDDGATVDLRRGDILIQHGTRHAWRNISDKPATLIFVLIGAHRM